MIMLSGLLAAAQEDAAFEQQSFCKHLSEVLDNGVRDNFASINGTAARQNFLVPVPSYSIKLERFPITYVDKDHRFVGKTNLNFDSLSAVQELEKYKAFVAPCLDSTHWHWSQTEGDDSTTVFFNELKEFRARQESFTITLAVIHAAIKVYSIVLYVKRN